MTSDDPLAPPPGYGSARYERHDTGQAVFTRCCQTGCMNAPGVVITLGCTQGEHVGEFPYCKGCWQQAVKLPIWCGRCQQPGKPRVPMRVLKTVRADGSPGAVITEDGSYKVVQSALDWAFEKGHAGGGTGDRQEGPGRGEGGGHGAAR